MLHSLAPALPFAVVLGGLLAIYFGYVRPRVLQYRTITDVLDTVESLKGPFAPPWWYRLWARFSARLSGSKTVILGALAALLPQIPPVLDILNGFTGWAVFLDQTTADKIAAGLAAATAITHVWGLVSAAKAIPADVQASMAGAGLGSPAAPQIPGGQ